MSGRPRSMREMYELQSKSWNPDDRARSIASYRPRRSDIVISPYAKCGTTWLQQAFHCLRTRGDMDFDDISRVVPWIETACALGLDLEHPQRAEPRGFKSHLPYDQIPKGARYVVSFRDPKDAIVSDYHFMKGWWFEPGTISLEQFVERPLSRLGTGRDYWHHLLSWWAERDNADVLLFSYEGMKDHPEAHIRALARFAGIASDEELLALTLKRISLAFMLAHRDRFDDRLMREHSERASGLPPGSDSAKVREGKVGSHKIEMSPAIATKVDEIWRTAVAPETGFETYGAFEAVVRARTGL